MVSSAAPDGRENVIRHDSLPDRHAGWLPLVLVALVLGVYGQVIGFDFCSYDDPGYVVLNPHVRGGLTWENVVWAFTTESDGNWIPLTFLSLMLDAELYDGFAGGYHLTNVLWHAANTVLVFRLLRQATGAAGRSAMVAALFGVHPLHVESVAWISERKDVLSTFFGLLSLTWYVRSRWERNRGWGVAAWSAFVCGLLSKPMLVTWPCVLVLLDFWPLQRWNGRLWGDIGPGEPRSTAGTGDGLIRGDKEQPAEGRTERLRGRRPMSLVRLIWEKGAWLLTAAVFCGVVYAVQHRQGAGESLKHLPLSLRAGNAILSYAVYLLQMVWPAHLGPHYPHPGTNLSWGMVALAGGVLGVVSGLAVREHRRTPYVLMGWLWYLGTLVPVIGLVQVGSQGHADRYTYIPLIGIFLLVVWGTVDVSERLRLSERWLTSAAGVVLAACLVLSWRQVGIWRDSRTLWGHAVQVAGESWEAHRHYGLSLLNERETRPAIEQFRIATNLNPHDFDARLYLGMALVIDAQDEGLNWLEPLLQELSQQPRYRRNLPRLEYYLGLGYWNRKDAVQAERHLLQALSLGHTTGATYRVLGQLYLREQRWDQAERFLQRATELDPQDFEAHNAQGEVFLQTGRRSEAAAAFRRALSVNPNCTAAAANLKRATPPD